MNVIGRSSVKLRAKMSVRAKPSRSRAMGRPKKYSTVGVMSTTEARGRLPLRDGAAVGDHKSIRRALVAAAQIGIAREPFEQAFAETQRLHAESRNHEQQIVGIERRHRPARRRRRDTSSTCSSTRPYRSRSSSETSPNARGTRVAKIVVAHCIDAGIPHGGKLHGPGCAERLRDLLGGCIARKRAGTVCPANRGAACASAPVRRERERGLLG